MRTKDAVYAVIKICYYQIIMAFAELQHTFQFITFYSIGAYIKRETKEQGLAATLP